MLSATITITNGSYTYTQELEKIANNMITVRNGFPYYKVMISKPGYIPYYYTFTSDSLKSYELIPGNLPLVVELKKGTSTIMNGLIAYYNFNNNILDQSGNGNDGTAYGDSTSYGVDTTTHYNPDGSYTFDGIKDYIFVKNDSMLNPVNAISISAWVRPVEYRGTGNDPLVVKPYMSHTYPYYQYSLGISGSKNNYYHFAFQLNINGGWIGVSTPNNFWTPGNWYYVVGMYDGEKLKIYVNGILKGTNNATGLIAAYNTDLYFADNPNVQFQNNTPVTIDNVRIYDRALSEEEILLIYNEEMK